MTTYDVIGRTYSGRRRSDPRIARRIEAALGDARSVVNVGAGAGSYEPGDREIVAVEPSAVMIAQRPPTAARVVQASAESLPFEDASFDAALAVLTLHHWGDRRAGLSEMCRVARHRVVVLTWVPEGPDFWLTRDYVAPLRALDRQIFPGADALREMLGGDAGALETIPVPVPHDCVDGFLGAYWRRPEAYLDPLVRASISSFARIDGVDEAMARLRSDLESGAWRRRNAELLELDELDIGYRLLVWRRDPGQGTS